MRSSRKKSEKEMWFDIWSEGFRATGDSGDATHRGRAQGKTFREACERFADTHPEFKKCYNQEANTYWGCRLFDNESDARRSFG